MREDRMREVAALLVELHDETGSVALDRAAVLDRWVRAYPEQVEQRSRPGRAAGRGQPGSRGADTVRRGLVELEAAGVVARRGGRVVLLLDVPTLEEVATE